MPGRIYPAAVSSVIFLQIDAVLQAFYLVGIAIVYMCWAFAKFADTALIGLAPARMVLLWVHVGIEPVFTRRHAVPGGGRHGIGKADFHDRFDSFKSIFPWN